MHVATVQLFTDGETRLSGPSLNIVQQQPTTATENTQPTCTDTEHTSLSHSWLNRYRWIAYSTMCDGAFCILCALLGDNHNRAAMGSFVNEPFRSWNKKNEKCDEHEHSKYH